MLLNKFFKTFVFLCLLLPILNLSVSAEENHIINGSFEEYGELNNGSWGTFKSIPGWNANKGLLEVQTNNVSGLEPVDGIAKVELDSNRNSKIFNS